MAPHHSAKAEKDQRLSSIIDFASRFQRHLDANTLGSSISEQLDQHLKKPFPVPPPSFAKQLDDLGKTLWNSAIRLRQSRMEISNLLSRLRVFAFHLLDMAHQSVSKQGQNTSANLIRVLRVSLKAERDCINNGELDLATLIFQRSASYVETKDRETGKQVREEEQEQVVRDEVMEQLANEYFLLRACHGWKIDRLDLTEYWLGKVFIHGDRENAASIVEKKADLLYEIGKAMIKKKQYDVAAKWLERSCNIIDTLDREALDPDCHELRFAAASDWIRALIEANDAASISKASHLFSLLQTEITEFKLSVCLLHLKLLSAQTPVEAEKFYNVLVCIIQSVLMIESNFDTIMQQISKLRKVNEINNEANSQSVSFACQALDTLLPRLYNLGNQTWLEKVVVTKVWIVVFEYPTSESASGLQEMFDEVLGTTGNPFGPEAAHAAQSLMWKHIDASFRAHNGEEPETWCRLACHALFQNAGELNKSKLGRKMILHALAKGDTSTAREAYFQMPESGKTAPITKYIMYKTALRSGDADLASESLNGVLKSSKKNPAFLYACALEAQQHGDRKHAITVLQRVLEHFNYNAPEGVHLPALIRSTAKMFMTELENDAIPKHEALLELCKLFEGAMAQSKSFRSTESDGSNDKFEAELRWFAGHTYNLALTHLADMHPELLLRLMTVCIAFVDLLRQENNDENDKGLVHRLLLCRFLAASALVVLGRSEDNVELSLSLYLDVRRQIEAFQICLKDALDSTTLQVDVQTDLAMKDFELLKYDLEALLKLQHWNDLDRVLGLCMAQKHNARWGTIVDLIIHIHTHITDEKLDASYQDRIPLVIEKIINAFWDHDKHDICKLARWMRCLFQMTLRIDTELALRCVGNARSMATRLRSAQSSQLYPEEELAWLATSAFNHAVDLYCDGQNKPASRPWAENALALAMETGQDPKLHPMLQAKWLSLQAP